MPGFLKRFMTDLRRHYVLWLMILPALLFFTLFNYLPLVGIYFAFTRYDFMQGYEPSFTP